MAEKNNRNRHLDVWEEPYRVVDPVCPEWRVIARKAQSAAEGKGIGLLVEFTEFQKANVYHFGKSWLLTQEQWAVVHRFFREAVDRHPKRHEMNLECKGPSLRLYYT